MKMVKNPNPLRRLLTIPILFSISLTGFAPKMNAAAQDPIVARLPSFESVAAQDEINLGEQTVAPGARPWHVALVSAFFSDAFWGYLCGGALIAPEWVVTAAHCVQDEGSGEVMASSTLEILVGATALNTTDGQRVAVSWVIPYPNFLDSRDDDIALIQLAQPVTLGRLVQTIAPLNPTETGLITPGTVAAVTGWGSQWLWGFLGSDQLRQVDVPIVSNSACQAAYDDVGLTITGKMLCAGADGLDACYGDSGGPLAVADGSGDGYKLAGIVSFGHPDGCGADGKYGGYTYVPAFVDWIDSYIGQKAA
jgi:secreted trypsin-like serine protease